MIIVIDNYDSFSYNLVQYLGELGAEPLVFRNDQVTVDELEALQPTCLVISPGPGRPEHDAGVSNEAIRRFHGRIPILGVCLGHQCIAHSFGGRVRRAGRLMHGKVSPIMHDGDALFAGLPATFEATRYHSLIVEEPLPEALRVTATTPEGEVMAIRHRDALTIGVQFHPESILTGHGKQLIRNFLRLGEEMTDGATLSQREVGAIDLPTAIERALERDHLTADEAESVMRIIMDGEATSAQIGAYLAAMRAKGETVAEITGFARAMRAHARNVKPTRKPLVDTCGTGGDGGRTFNISTAAALVVAGAGVAVAKHGNRSVSSQCGSADVLEALGVNLGISPQAMADCIDEHGFGFLFAPSLHPAMKHAIGPRREMGVRTVFNLLGPLTNPAGASVQVIGVYDGDLVLPVARVLRELGSRAAYVVHSAEGLDELATTGVNHVAALRDGTVTPMLLDPQEYGLPRASLDQLRGGDPQGNVGIVRDVLAGQRGPRRDVVLLNAALALVAAEVAGDVQSAIALAAESIDSGRAQAVLDDVIAYTQEAA